MLSYYLFSGSSSKHAFVFRDGNFYGFGDSTRGQLGMDRFPSALDVKDVVAGSMYTVYLTNKGLLYKAGKFYFEDDNVSNVPKLVSFFTVDDPVMLQSGGPLHYICLTRSNSLYAIGNGGKGRLGLGHTSNVKTFKLIDFDGINPDAKIIQIACGRWHNYILFENGKLYSFGCNNGGKLGIGKMSPESYKSVPVNVSMPKSKYVWPVKCVANSNGGFFIDSKNNLWVVGEYFYEDFGFDYDENYPNLTSRFKRTKNKVHKVDFVDNEELIKDDFEEEIETIKNENEEKLKKLKEKNKKLKKMLHDAKSKGEESFEDDYEKYKITANELLLDKKIGEGGFGKCYEGTWDGSGGGVKVVIKEINLQGIKVTNEQVYKEIKIHLDIMSPVICRVFGFALPEPTKIYIVMEKMDFDVLQMIKQRKYSLNQKLGFMKQMTQCVHVLHQRNVLHRDLKCSNFLADKSGRIKITDFGIATVMKHSQTHIQSGGKGSMPWMDPDLVDNRRGKVEFSTETDIYSLGCCFYEVLFEEPPFAILLNRFDRKIKEFKKEGSISIPSKVIKMIKLCICENKSKRLTSSYLLRWFNKNGEEDGEEDEEGEEGEDEREDEDEGEEDEEDEGEEDDF